MCVLRFENQRETQGVKTSSGQAHCHVNTSCSTAGTGSQAVQCGGTKKINHLDIWSKWAQHFSGVSACSVLFGWIGWWLTRRKTAGWKQHRGGSTNTSQPFVHGAAKTNHGNNNKTPATTESTVHWICENRTENWSLLLGSLANGLNCFVYSLDEPQHKGVRPEMLPFGCGMNSLVDGFSLGCRVRIQNGVIRVSNGSFYCVDAVNSTWKLLANRAGCCDWLNRHKEQNNELACSGSLGLSAQGQTETFWIWHKSPKSWSSINFERKWSRTFLTFFCSLSLSKMSKCSWVSLQLFLLLENATHSIAICEASNLEDEKLIWYTIRKSDLVLNVLQNDTL